MLYLFMMLFSESQTAKLNPTTVGSKLIFPAPFRVGVIRNNQFAVWEA
jgi:hypothetical protein